MAILLWNQWNEDWNYQWKCTFVGETRQIIINPGFTDISVKTDIYSGWKEWVALRDNTKFPPAIRSIGGDKISETESAGDRARYNCMRKTGTVNWNVRDYR